MASTRRHERSSVNTVMSFKSKLSRSRKLYKLRKRQKQKRARIIIRNLPYTLSEEALKEHFSKYGNIEEAKIPQKQNGSHFGYGFIQYERVQSAAQAIHYENLQTISNRKIVVNWAIAKDKYEKMKASSISAASESTEVKEEMDESLDNSDIKVKEEKLSDEEDIKEEQDSVEEPSDAANDSDVNSSQHPRRISNDVNEGKTVFIKNIPFTANNDDLKECMQQFGPVYYALICMDPMTEHSKGTAFVKFRNIEDAEKCLAASTELKLHDQILDPHRALHRFEVNEKNKEKKKKDKDSRNLYLAKEGGKIYSNVHRRNYISIQERSTLKNQSSSMDLRKEKENSSEFQVDNAVFKFYNCTNVTINVFTDKGS